MTMMSGCDWCLQVAYEGGISRVKREWMMIRPADGVSEWCSGE